MAAYHSSGSDGLLASVLGPLLEDFQHWFQRALDRLTGEQMSFLTVDQQQGLITRLQRALAEVQTANTLLQATDGQVGVETSQVIRWHALVSECWSVARQYRLSQANQPQEEE